LKGWKTAIQFESIGTGAELLAQAAFSQDKVLNILIRTIHRKQEEKKDNEVPKKNLKINLRPRSEISRSLYAGGIPLRFNGAARDTQDQVESHPRNDMHWEGIIIGPEAGRSSNLVQNHRLYYLQRANQEYACCLDELNEDVPTGSIKLLDAGLLKAEETAKTFALFQTYQPGYILFACLTGDARRWILGVINEDHTIR
jgi:hypothetical protein